MKNIIILLTTLVGMVMTADAHVAFKQVANITNVTMSKLLQRGYSGKTSINFKTDFTDACLERAKKLEILIQQNASIKDSQVNSDLDKNIASLRRVVKMFSLATRKLQELDSNLSLTKKLLDAKATLKSFEKK